MQSIIFELPFLNIAHRGARSLAPENTLQAARRAFEQGAHMWELDACMSRDGVPVVIHDETLERTSNVQDLFPHRRPWRVAEFSLEELRRLDFGTWFTMADPFGQIKEGKSGGHDLKSMKGLPILTLHEALQWTGKMNWLVNVEIKDVSETPHHASVAALVVRQIQSLEMEARVLVSSFNHEYLRQVRRECMNIPTGVLADRQVAEPHRLLEELGAQAFHPHADVVPVEQLRSMKDRGLPVFVWVVNEAKAMARWIDAGARGIFTDFPHRLTEVLKGRRQVSWEREQARGEGI